MSVNVPADEARVGATRPLRVAIELADPVQAARLRAALSLIPDLQLLPHAALADIVVRDARPAAPAVQKVPLTPREQDVLELLALGASNKMIARRLGISLATTKFHVAGLFAKLGARSRSDAVANGVRRGHLML
jgi:DNA-binding NarL/FixJ family response regulator